MFLLFSPFVFLSSFEVFVVSVSWLEFLSFSIFLESFSPFCNSHDFSTSLLSFPHIAHCSLCIDVREKSVLVRFRGDNDIQQTKNN